ncbi:hypothetical protein MKW98_021203 [Papaver atlanticum]|uniref:2-C-methyl-D-erythritol 2,4-cyclodiphosphate synthase domain-containing protein n=1 Tax=Papaver atlanticum TaxID=357466 RepID=A0AAD4XU52_9MAGN|nr:hypothetical protein MKW98_021203 [Papaver atlanticum]
MEVERETATTLKKLSSQATLPFRSGHGFDIQKLVPAYPWIIGGQYIRYSLGCEASPKADVLYQSIVDAILGALGLPDAEEMFPWFNPKWDGASSSVFVAEAVELAYFRRELQLEIS